MEFRDSTPCTDEKTRDEVAAYRHAVKEVALGVTSHVLDCKKGRFLQSA